MSSHTSKICILFLQNAAAASEVVTAVLHIRSCVLVSFSKHRLMEVGLIVV